MAVKKLPSHVKVFGTKIKITQEPEANMPDLLGEFIADESRIRISNKLNQDAARETLLHEIIHAAFFISGHSELLKPTHEEALIRMLEKALIPFINESF